MITFFKRLASAIPTPSAGKVTLFVDSTSGKPSYKDESGTVGDFAGPKGDKGDAGTTTWAGLTGDPIILPLAPFTLATLPPAADNAGNLLRVTDHTAGTGVCVSDGTNWIDISTGVTVA